VKGIPTAPGRFAFRALEAVVACAMLGLMLVVTFDVAGRYLFNRPLTAGYELVQGLMGLLAFAALPLVSRYNDHIKLGLLDHLYGGWTDRLRRAWVHAFSAAALSFLTWRLWIHAGKLAAVGDSTAVLELPLAPLGYFMAFAAALSAALLAILAVRTLARG
jgi:TRAP-type transport system small permease protein